MFLVEESFFSKGWQQLYDSYCAFRMMCGSAI